jgi:crossover junction endodeoxyribonuclease RusA
MIVKIELPPINMALSPNSKNGKSYLSTLNAKKSDKAIGFFYAKKEFSEKLQPATNYPVNIIFYSSTKKFADLDNLLSASKNRIDGIANALGIDDRQFRPITIDGQYRKGDAGMIFEINIGDNDER